MYQALLLSSLLICVAASIPAASQPSTPDPSKSLARLRTQVNRLLTKSQPELYERHLRSVLALAEEGFVRLSLNAPDHDAQAKEFVQYVNTISQGMKGDASKADSYLVDGKRTLVLARLSKLDGSLQYYMLQLPKGWQPDKAYPLLVSLHGAGPTNPLAYVSFCFPQQAATASSLAQSTLPDMIVVSPWGRGNRGWVNDGERDLWEALDDCSSFCSFDPDRRYITGHSMGADGVWGLVQRTPDMWAAAGMQAGTMRAAPLETGLLGNIAHVPFYIWIGADDALPGRNDSAKEARDALESIGNPPMFVESAGVGHMPRPEDTQAEVQWLVNHIRARPTSFEYLIDSPTHRGVWGISVPNQRRGFYYSQMNPPRFQCTIDGSVVHIETANANQLTVDLGAHGLQMSGSVELILNGKSVFNGPVPDVPLELTP